MASEKPLNLFPMTTKEKIDTFGSFSYVPTPCPECPELIKVTGSKGFDIATVEVPQLEGVKGAGKRGQVLVNALLSYKLFELFQAWEDRGLMLLVLSWDGGYVPRFVRGSRFNLSNHAWGTAFDVNASHNPLGKQGPAVGEIGSTWLLAEAAAQLGWYWGGWFPGRPDPMHFEIGVFRD